MHVQARLKHQLHNRQVARGETRTRGVHGREQAHDFGAGERARRGRARVAVANELNVARRIVRALPGLVQESAKETQRLQAAVHRRGRVSGLVTQMAAVRTKIGGRQSVSDGLACRVPARKGAQIGEIVADGCR